MQSWAVAQRATVASIGPRLPRRASRAAPLRGPVRRSARASRARPPQTHAPATMPRAHPGIPARARRRRTGSIGRSPANNRRMSAPPSTERMPRCTQAASAATSGSSRVTVAPAAARRSTAKATARRTAAEGARGPASSHHPTRRRWTGGAPTTGVPHSPRNPASASSTVRARKPARDRWPTSRGIVSKAPPPPSVSARGSRPTIPQACAGWRMLPARSVPMASGTHPAATSAASPPLLPPGPRWASVG